MMFPKKSAAVLLAGIVLKPEGVIPNVELNFSK